MKNKFIPRNGLILDENGNKIWYLNGNRHRADGPAVEWANGDKFWYLNDNLHRVDGPAIILYNRYKEWHVNGERFDCKTQEEFEQYMRLKAFH